MEAFIAFLGTLPFPQMIILLVTLFIGYSIFKRFNCEKLYSEIQDCKNTHQAQLWAYISDQLGIIEAHSMNKAQDIIDKSPDLECEVKCGVNPKMSQLNFFGLILERCLYHDVFEKLKTAIRINGFHEMTDKELEAYIEEKADTLLRSTRKKINQRIYFYPLLKNTDEQRFTLDEAVKFTGKIIRKAIAVKKDEVADVAKIREKYSITTKLKVWSKLLKKQ